MRARSTPESASTGDNFGDSSRADTAPIPNTGDTSEIRVNPLRTVRAIGRTAGRILEVNQS